MHPPDEEEDEETSTPDPEWLPTLKRLERARLELFGRTLDSAFGLLIDNHLHEWRGPEDLRVKLLPLMTDAALHASVHHLWDLHDALALHHYVRNLWLYFADHPASDLLARDVLARLVADPSLLAVCTVALDERLHIDG